MSERSRQGRAKLKASSCKAGKECICNASWVERIANRYPHARDDAARSVERAGGKTPLTLKELDQADLLAKHLVVGIGERGREPDIAAAAKRRQQAFSLLVNAYDQARRALAFVRWSEGDADRIAPSLYASRKPRRRKQAADAPPATAIEPLESAFVEHAAANASQATR